jgi:hypothetical protein
MAQYYVNYPKAPRGQTLVTGQGLITESFSRLAPGVTTNIMVDGTAYLIGVGLRANDRIANVAIIVATGGATLTLSKVGLYKKDGTRVAVSDDQGTAWQSAGLKNVALSSAYMVPVDDIYYVAIVSKGGTLPTLIRGSNSLSAAVAVGSGSLPYGSVTAQTDLPASLTVAAGTAPIAYWVGVS